MSTHSESGLLTYQGASQLLGVPVGTLYNWVSLKRIPFIRLTERMVRFDAAELARWLNERRVQPGGTQGGRSEDGWR